MPMIAAQYSSQRLFSLKLRTVPAGSPLSGKPQRVNSLASATKVFGTLTLAIGFPAIASRASSATAVPTDTKVTVLPPTAPWPIYVE
ncbi:hypothetical protein D9M70_564070 [compost metagenome]